MSIILLLFIGIPVFWVMVKTAKYSAPISALLGLAILSVGVTAQNWGLIKFGGGLFAFSASLFVFGGGMRGR
jgi:uncharacterized protein YqgC (DUF456 family)